MKTWIRTHDGVWVNLAHARQIFIEESEGEQPTIVIDQDTYQFELGSYYSVEHAVEVLDRLMRDLTI